MSYPFVKSSNFIRAARKIAKRNPDFIIELNDVLNSLSDNPFEITLKTHKLKGELKNCWACSINYDLRLIFQFVNAIDETGGTTEAILLLTVGSHDEVY